MNTERKCLEEGLLHNVEALDPEHFSRHLQGLKIGERSRKRPRLVYEEGQGGCHSDGLQTLASANPAYADTTHLIQYGSFDQLAISLGPDLGSQIHSAGKAARALEQQEWLLQDAERALHLAEAQVSSIHFALQSARDDEEYVKLEEVGERSNAAAQKASERRDAIKTTLEVLGRTEKLYKNQLQQLLERTLEEAGLLDASSLEPNPPQYQNQGDNVQDDDDHDSLASIISDGTALSTSEILRRTACEDLSSAQQAKEKAEPDFENRGEIYLNQLYQYEQAFQTGQIDMTRTTFDGHMFNHTQGLTRARF